MELLHHWKKLNRNKIIRTIEGLMPKWKWLSRNQLNGILLDRRMIIMQTLRDSAKQLGNCFQDVNLINSTTAI